MEFNVTGNKNKLCLQASLTKLLFSRQIFIKSPISNFMTIRPVGGALILAERQTDGHDEANWGFSRLRERA
jgi:hypothetical protein